MIALVLGLLLAGCAAPVAEGEACDDAYEEGARACDDACDAPFVCTGGTWAPDDTCVCWSDGETCGVSCG